MKRGAEEGAVEAEATDRAAKSRPEHWVCPVCSQERSGSGFVWKDGRYVCNSCAAKEQPSEGK